MSELVSVIIPAYNAATTITAAVHSALAQSHAEIEVIVVDDGSSDATADAARQAADGDARLRVIEQENGGVSAARNAALDAARGDWIALLDADDTYDPSRLERLLSIARVRNVDLVADNISIFDGTSPKRVAFPEQRMARTTLVRAVEFVACDRPRRGLSSAGFIKPIFRRAFLEAHRLRYRVGANVGEDFDFVLRALLRGARLAYSQTRSTTYTVQVKSLSRGDEDRFYIEFAEISAKLMEEAKVLNEPGIVKALQRRAVDTKRWYFSIGFEQALDRRDVRAAARHFAALPSKVYGVYLVATKVRRAILSVALRR